ncbi:hypothetical protein INR49_024830 [Caranx melampygus]|nr:hypothetical protein INR49_024830 [Caranx melampygus]
MKGGPTGNRNVHEERNRGCCLRDPLLDVQNVPLQTSEVKGPSDTGILSGPVKEDCEEDDRNEEEE